MDFTVRPMLPEDIAGTVALQRVCFPAPFPDHLLWTAAHLHAHLDRFPAGQFVATTHEQVVGSASNLIVSEGDWHSHRNWEETVGGAYLESHDPTGTTLYGVDISVHPAWREQGVGRALYTGRFNLVKDLRLARYGTACRLPDFSRWHCDNPGGTPKQYAEAVAAREAKDRTMTPLLRYGLGYAGIIENYMDDEESGHAAAVLEWRPD